MSPNTNLKKYSKPRLKKHAELRSITFSAGDEGEPPSGWTDDEFYRSKGKEKGDEHAYKVKDD